jgi:hypothetical protein
LPKLVSVRQPKGVNGRHNSCSCDACERDFENPIQLTNLSAMPAQIYSACPFCFSKLSTDQPPEEPSPELWEPNPEPLKPGSEMDSSTDSPNRLEQRDISTENASEGKCAHYFGYLKKRPKSAAVPDSCLTCEKMIKCLL